jgi:predicted Zn-ribbon and HTH transcriptional regulator
VILRERIETVRQQQIKSSSAKQIKYEINENSKDTIIESLKRKVKCLEHKGP